MGKFDIGNTYHEDCPVSWHSLYMELVNEFEFSHPGEFIDEDTIRDKFTNSDGSGLVDKLKSVLNFDIRTIAGTDNAERFNMFKVLKLLFYIEKCGDPKTKATCDNYRVQITDILAKPRLSNMISKYTPFSVYGEHFGKLYTSIKSVVADADQRELRLEKINSYWEYITDKIFDYVMNDSALEHPENALKELERIHCFLKTKVLERLKNHDVIHLSKPEKVLPSFFNLLACHKLLCNENDRIRLNYEICLNPPPDSDYIKFFKKSEKYKAEWDYLSLVKARLKNKNNDPAAEFAIALISYGNDID